MDLYWEAVINVHRNDFTKGLSTYLLHWDPRMWDDKKYRTEGERIPPVTATLKDWVKDGAVTGVRHQLDCNTEVHFAVVGALESYHKIHKHELKEFSEGYLTECYEEGADKGLRLEKEVLDSLAKNLNDNEIAAQVTRYVEAEDKRKLEAKTGCGLQHNNVREVLEYVLEHGIPEAKAYEYIIPEGGKVAECKKEKLKNIFMHKFDFEIKVLHGEKEMGEALKHGPIIGLFRTSELLPSYDKGVYLLFNNYFCNKAFHAGLIVGIGEEIIHGKKIRYWKIKNSWGKKFGEGGYLRLARGLNTCEVENIAYALVPTEKGQQIDRSPVRARL